MTYSKRFIGMVLSWGMVGLVYTLSGLRGVGGAHFLTPSAIDLWLPFAPSAIWLYLSFFILVGMGYFLSTAQGFGWFCRAVLLCALGAGIVFALYPTTMEFPPVTQSGISADLLVLLMRHDALLNCLPSLHVALSLLAAVALWRAWSDWRGVLVWIWAIAICLSILILRRHQAVDLVTGAMLAGFAGLLAPYLPLPKALREEVVA